MCNLKKELENTDKIMKDCKIPGYGKIYFASNENLKSIFGGFDIKNKKVLSVVGSGDQSFYFLNGGAKKVDVFDMNKLSKYYYYLRIWFIVICNRFYPPYNLSNSMIRKLLGYVRPKTEDEVEAYNYWRSFTDIYDHHDDVFQNLFEDGIPTVLKNNVENISKIKERIKSRDFTFYNVDISKSHNIKDKYDIIYTSNIFDWLKYNDYDTYRDNLFELLNDDGIVMCADLARSYGATPDEKRCFNESFNYYRMPTIQTDVSEVSRPFGYCFVKNKRGIL